MDIFGVRSGATRWALFCLLCGCFWSPPALPPHKFSKNYLSVVLWHFLLKENTLHFVKVWSGCFERAISLQFILEKKEGVRRVGFCFRYGVGFAWPLGPAMGNQFGRRPSLKGVWAATFFLKSSNGLLNLKVILKQWEGGRLERRISDRVFPKEDRLTISREGVGIFSVYQQKCVGNTF